MSMPPSLILPQRGRKLMRVPLVSLHNKDLVLLYLFLESNPSNLPLKGII
jgi:hypothetical protein